MKELGSLAKNGVVLEKAYTLPICTPSRFLNVSFSSQIVKRGQELLLRMDGEYLQFCFFRLDPIKFMNVKQSPKCSTRTHKKLVHYIGYPKHLDDWTNKQKLANQQEIYHYFCSKIMSSFHFLHRAALMTGVYPFKMGLQRGFGKRSPQVSSNFVLI